MPLHTNDHMCVSCWSCCSSMVILLTRMINLAMRNEKQLEHEANLPFFVPPPPTLAAADDHVAKSRDLPKLSQEVYFCALRLGIVQLDLVMRVLEHEVRGMAATLGRRTIS